MYNVSVDRSRHQSTVRLRWIDIISNLAWRGTHVPCCKPGRDSVVYCDLTQFSLYIGRHSSTAFWSSANQRRNSPSRDHAPARSLIRSLVLSAQCDRRRRRFRRWYRRNSFYEFTLNCMHLYLAQGWLSSAVYRVAQKVSDCTSC